MCDFSVYVNFFHVANTSTTKKDKSKFVATSSVKSSKVFITAETDLSAVNPGTQVVWSTGSF